MKQFFALAISCLAVAAVAQPKAQMNAVSGMDNHVKMGTRAMHFDPQTPVQKMQLLGNSDRVVTLDRAKAMNHAPAGVADGAYYRPSSENLKVGLFFSDQYQAWGYSYNTPILLSQAFKGTYDRVAGSRWTIGTADNDIEGDELNEDGNYDMALAGMGVGGYYTPKIWSKRGASYFYGADDADAPEYSVNYKGDVEQSWTVGTYQLYGDVTLYSGFSNTLAFGARDFESGGKHIQSDKVLVDYGNLGGGFVLQYLELPIITHEQGDPYYFNDDVVTVELFDINEETGEVKTYTTTVGADDVFTDDGTDSGMPLIHATFTTVDENGFETEIEPVLNGYVQLLLSGFKQEGVNWGLRMCWDNTASDDTWDGGDIGATHGYYDQWVDGVQTLDDEGNVAFFGEECIEPVLSFVGYYNALCEYGTGELVMSAEIPVEGGYAVTAIDEDGTVYNDFDVASSFSMDFIEIVDAPEWVGDLEYDDQYFDNDNISNVLMFFVSADALPAGVSGREGDVVLCSNGEVYMTLHVTQGTVGISQIQNDAVKNNVYNLQGVKVSGDLQSGLYIQNGKKIVKK